VSGALFLDFETRSYADLKARGGYNYADDDTTEVLCLAALLVVNGAPVKGWLWTPFKMKLRPIAWQPPRLWSDLEGVELAVGADDDSVIDDLEQLAANGVPFLAHNAIGFDRYIWNRLSDERPRWIDTLARSRRRGLPGGLDKLGEALYGQGKTTGKTAMMRLAIPNKNTGEFNKPNRDTLSATMQYCLDDVLLQACAWIDDLGLGEEPPIEATLIDVDAAINARGFVFDSKLAAAILRTEREIRSREERVVREATDGAVSADVLRSTKKLGKWLGARGVEAGNLQSDTCLAMIRHPMLDSTVRTVLWARIGVNRIASNKLEKGVTHAAHDQRVRNSLAYYGGFTGRWGGRNIQPQNLPRPNEDVDAIGTADRLLAGHGLAAIVDAARDAGCNPDDVIGTLVRSCIVPSPGKRFAVIDFSAVEARVAAWLADDEEGLAVYRARQDPYVVMASHLYGKSYDEIMAGLKVKDPAAKMMRQAGKVASLGCQYQMGFDRFAEFAAGYGVDLHAAGISPQHAVEGFRDLRPLLAGQRIGKVHEESGVALRKGGIWKSLHRKVFDVVTGKLEGGAYIARCFWGRLGAHLICVLPSGRYLIYRNARIEDVEPSWGGDPRPTVTYDHVVGQTVTRAAQYGGKAFENITQAVARDLLAVALVRLEQADLPTVLHVHDEAIFEVDRATADADLQRGGELMAEPPEWAIGLPIGVDGYVCDRYGKKGAEGAGKVVVERELQPAPVT
jgi:DNA polymerase